MDAKDTWPVVKFIVAATGLKREDARQYLDEIPKEKYPSLYLLSRRWERDSEQSALQLLEGLVGQDTSGVLSVAVERSRIPSHKQTGEPAMPGKRKKKKP